MLLQLSHFFSSLYSPPPCVPLPPAFPHFSSCPWILHTSSLASPFPILFLPFPCLFSTYHLCFLFPVPFPPFSHLPLPIDNSPCDLIFLNDLLIDVISYVTSVPQLWRCVCMDGHGYTFIIYQPPHVKTDWCSYTTLKHTGTMKIHS